MSERTIADIMRSNECNTYVMSCHINRDELYKSMREDIATLCDGYATLKAQRDELLELLKWSDEKLGPEINPSNYDHQDVCELNANMVEVCLAIRAAIANAEKDKTEC